DVFHQADTAADGGVQWPYYLGLYGNYTIWNYAVGGAVCSNSLTPLYGEPDVSGGQMDWFIQDHIGLHGRLLLDPDSFSVIIFVGTNDVGFGSFLTDDQPDNSTLPDIADCQLHTIRRLHSLGARKFVLNLLTPLQLTKLYSNSSDPTIYHPAPHNGTVWHKRMNDLVHTMNRLLSDGVKSINSEWRGNGRVEIFDTYRLFQEMFHHPMRYFNGSIPANVTGHCHQCPDPDDYRQCGLGDCTLDQRDSYMYWDELHPSEQYVVNPQTGAAPGNREVANCSRLFLQNREESGGGDAS
ncbi:hypothetical protein EXIGLDRAFT_810005, partial [Exidia glandulosa HHB12029]